MPNYNILLKQAKSLAEQNTDSKLYNITFLANISALLFNSISDLNWLGFYIVENDNLVLGPFQGKVACTYIENGHGVCGTCLKEKSIINVSNVHEFAGHIACDSASNSELVLPIIKNDKVIYILDIDSPLYNRFDSNLTTFFTEIKNLLDLYIK